MIFNLLKNFFYYSLFPHVKQKHWTSICAHENEISCAVCEFQKAISLQGYFDRQSLDKWKNAHRHIFSDCSFDYEFLLRGHKAPKTFRDFSKYTVGCEKIRDDYNKRFIKQALQSNEQFFDVIEKNPLTKRQREAIVIDDNRNLVIAGAGTGKTSTLVGKCAYLVEKLKVDPSRILLLAFNKDAVEELKTRMQVRCKEVFKRDLEFNVSTFHSLGLQIIKECEGYRETVKDREGDIRKIFYNRIQEKAYLDKLLDYFLRHHVYAKDYLDFESFKEYEEFKKESKGLDTLCGERVDSTEERDIADFLFRNQIKYVWNKKYEVNTVTEEYKRQYQPDFYLSEYNIYIEHWGVGEPDRSGKYTVPRWFTAHHGLSARDEYLAGMDWKRKLHKKNATKLIETFSFEKKKGILLENLKRKLLEVGVKVNPMPADKLFEHIQANFSERNENFSELVITLLSIMKSNLIDINEARKRFELNGNSERRGLFLDLFEPLYSDYEKYLSNNQKLDFDDMISKAVKHLEDKPSLREFDYILVDEFQDMSHGRYRLISALLKNNPKCKLFAVGDDWQSIYGFTGSDISIITKFEKYFGAHEQIQLDRTFRYNDQILNVSREFIQKNGYQIKKNDLSTLSKASDRAVEAVQKSNPGEWCLRNLCEKIDKDAGASGKKYSVFVLNRRNDPYGRNFDEYRFVSAFKNIKIEFKTVHTAKGLEADFVIIDNVEKLIFPSETITDEIIKLILPVKEDFPFAEERRIFYVALTRAKSKVYILGYKEKLSGFLKEVEEIERAVYKRAVPGAVGHRRLF